MKNKKDLIAQISQNLVPPPSSSAPATGASKRSASRSEKIPLSKAKKAQTEELEVAQDAVTPRSTGSGKQAAFWLDDEDRAIFHETGMLLYSQGIKPSHNLVLRAAIRMIPRDHRLVEKVRELIEKDGRKLRHQKK